MSDSEENFDDEASKEQGNDGEDSSDSAGAGWDGKDE